jgi:hypothetical protein
MNSTPTLADKGTQRTDLVDGVGLEHLDNAEPVEEVEKGEERQRFFYTDGKEAKGGYMVPAWLGSLVAWDDNPIRESEIYLFTMLCSWANRERTGFPSVATICERTGFKRAWVYKVLNNLEQVGAISRTHRYRKDSDHKQTANLYLLASNDGPLPTGELPAGSKATTPPTIERQTVAPIGGSGATSTRISMPEPADIPLQRTGGVHHSGIEGSTTVDTKNHLQSELCPEELTTEEGHAFQPAKTASQNAWVREDDDLLVAKTLLADEMLRHFPYMTSEQVAYRIEEVEARTTEACFFDDVPEDVPLGMAAVTHRLRNRRMLVHASVSAPLEKPAAVLGVVKMVLMVREKSGFWSGAMNMDMREEWDDFVESATAESLKPTFDPRTGQISTVVAA